jgi:hypothetical protein
MFNSTSTSFTGPPFGTQFNFTDFQFDSNTPQTFDIQAQPDIQVPSDSWFESLLSVLPLDNANPGLEGHQPQFLGVPQNLGAPTLASAAMQGMFPFPESRDINFLILTAPSSSTKLAIVIGTHSIGEH